MPPLTNSDRALAGDSINTFLTNAWGDDSLKQLWSKVQGIGLGEDGLQTGQYVVYAAVPLTDGEKDQIVQQIQGGPGGHSLVFDALNQAFPPNSQNTRFSTLGAPLEGGTANFRGNDLNSIPIIQGGSPISGLGGVGTLGTVFRKSDSGDQLYALTAAHVVTGRSATPFLKCPPAGRDIHSADPVLCQSAATGDADAAYVPVYLASAPPTFSSYLFMLNNRRPRGTALAQRGQTIYKVGAVSDYTSSEVESIEATILLPNNRTYKGAVISKTWFAGAGDSGSLGLINGDYVVGLVYYGFADKTLLMPIDYLFPTVGSTRLPCWNFDPVWNWT